LDDYLRRDSELEKKEKELKECVQRAQAKIGPNIIAGNSSLKMAVLFRLSLSGQRGLTPKELHRDRLLLNGYVGKRVSSIVATYSMCLNRLVDDGYAEKTKEGRTYRYYRNLAGQEYLRYVLKRDERRQADKAMWKRSQETADLAFFNGKVKITSMERRQLVVDKVSEIMSEITISPALRLLIPLMEALREVAGDISLVQLLNGCSDTPSSHDMISKLTCWTMDKIDCLADRMVQTMTVLEMCRTAGESNVQYQTMIDLKRTVLM